ncbi:signal peptidase I [Methanobacterium sp. ACI-7]|uniref:signal peptidase I n=1 Tax=unclassified Methanobacterium TaxID=2627676 RepID=UPI0039C43200
MDLKEIATYIIIILIGIIAAQHMNVVVSGSMEPVLYRGDIVIIDNNPDKNNLQVGDIVVYRATWFPQPVIHRVIKIDKTSEGNLYTIQGDNNPSQDPAPVHPNQIISKVVNYPWSNDPGQAPVVIPKIGYVTLWIRGL